MAGSLVKKPYTQLTMRKITDNANVQSSCVVSSSLRLYYMVVFRQQYEGRSDDFSRK